MMYAFEVELSKLSEEVLAALNPSLGRTSLDGKYGAIRTEIAKRAYPDINLDELPLTPVITKENYVELLNGFKYSTGEA